MLLETNKDRITRIGVFYDGNYFLHVSNFYNYVHERRTRISISGLHNFIRHEIAKEQESDVRLCQIVDAHYFRGRLSAGEASKRGSLLYFERIFDDILMAQGITTHYLPVKNIVGRKLEKDVDMALALEAFELAFYKRFDVIVLIASDSDYVPLIRKLNTLGTRLMVLSWDFEYYDEEGSRFTTQTSQDLFDEVTYPLAMHLIIDSGERKDDPLVEALFVPRTKERLFSKHPQSESEDVLFIENQIDYNSTEAPERKESTILSLKEGFGFIKFPPNNVFFHYTSIVDYDFNDLEVGDKVRFTLNLKESGEMVASNVVVVE